MLLIYMLHMNCSHNLQAATSHSSNLHNYPCIGRTEKPNKCHVMETASYENCFRA